MFFDVGRRRLTLNWRKIAETGIVESISAPDIFSLQGLKREKSSSEKNFSLTKLFPSLPLKWRKALSNFRLNIADFESSFFPSC